MQVLEDWLRNTLVIIPARRDSKGLPGKNKRLLGNRPLYRYSVDVALEIFPSENICLSTDDEEIIAGVQGLCQVELRPPELALDHTSMNEVLLHILPKFPEKKWCLLLQPTSPFRSKQNILEALKLMQDNQQAQGVYSVSVSKHIPGYTLFQVEETGELKLQANLLSGRQEAGEWLALNGSIYWFQVEAFLRKGALSALNPIFPYQMGRAESVDIDTEEDWEWAEYYSTKYLR
jgi:CMP-N,N'-diacetyllegionaminic acid synthase